MLFGLRWVGFGDTNVDVDDGETCGRHVNSFLARKNGSWFYLTKSSLGQLRFGAPLPQEGVGVFETDSEEVGLVTMPGS